MQRTIKLMYLTLLSSYSAEFLFQKRYCMQNRLLILLLCSSNWCFSFLSRKRRKTTMHYRHFGPIYFAIHIKHSKWQTCKTNFALVHFAPIKCYLMYIKNIIWSKCKATYYILNKICINECRFNIAIFYYVSINWNSKAEILIRFLTINNQHPNNIRYDK